MPPDPVQANVYVEVDIGVMVWLPEVALVPLQAPEAVQEVVLVELQVKLEDPPVVTDIGEALKFTEGVVGFPKKACFTAWSNTFGFVALGL